MTSQAEAGAEAPRTTLPILRFSTSDLPPEERYRAWYLRDWPRAAPIYRTEPTEPFNTTWVSAQLGPVMFARVEITAMRWERRLADIRQSDFDPIIVSLMARGEAKGDFDGRPFHETAGTLHFHDLGRASLHGSSASLTYNFVLTRALAREWFGSLSDLHGLVAPVEQAALVFALAEQIDALLPTLDAAQAERLGRMTLEALAVCLAGVRPRASETATPAAVLRRRAVEWIEDRLANRGLGSDEVCAAIGATRAKLFDAFRKEGGVRGYILGRRLERCRAALAELERDEPISAIAYRLGMADAAHLSRAFRERYGMSPSEYRRLLHADREMISSEG